MIKYLKSDNHENSSFKENKLHILFSKLKDSTLQFHNMRVKKAGEKSRT